mmetsp:Transcript_106970/g.301264  ORF Transcript_106970/g.301264 Transcript_106970/m.301264 type:complete len:340 (-) Transcript_106970:82-1101(-)
MRLLRVRAVLLLALLVATALPFAEALYTQPPCAVNEIQGEVQGATGFVCSPRCEATTYNCPTDVPNGATAQPQCMLQDINQNALCGLLCQVDAQCPSGAQCKQLRQVEVGICLYPVSFADWAKQGSQTQKLAVGWPSKPAQKAPADFQIAKTYTALQNIKSRYSIDDGDADMLTLKELLSSMNAKKAPAALGQAAAAPAAVVSAQPRSPDGLPHDVTQFEGYVSQGIPGFERELHDTVWNIEHFEHRYALTNLLSGVFCILGIYFGAGSFIKYQQGARGMDVIPHVGFWCEYPRLVGDGVKYSKILFGMGAPSDSGELTGGLARGVHSRAGGSGSFDPL